jgi:DNA-binding CsgD family transcriptional regulator
MENRINVEHIKELESLAENHDSLFIIKFHEYFYRFIARLNSMASPGLNGAEIEICAYIKIHFSTKDIALYTKCSVRSVENKKYRIRKKLRLNSNVDLLVFIAGVTNDVPSEISNR